MASALVSEAFVRWLRQVAPYVHAFRGRTFVVAFGGELFTERTRFLAFVHDLNLLAALGIRLVLVHGASVRRLPHLPSGLPRAPGDVDVLEV